VDFDNVAEDNDRRGSTSAFYGATVRAIRAQRKLSLSQLAERADISTAYLSMIEQGARTPTPEVVNRIAEGLEIDPDRVMLIPAIVKNVLDAFGTREVPEQIARLTREFERVEAELRSLAQDSEGRTA
jgi:transcriptional regulator with XRE-family HTH domain